MRFEGPVHENIAGPRKEAAAVARLFAGAADEQRDISIAVMMPRTSVPRLK